MRSNRMRLVGHVARRGDKGNAYGVVVGKPEEKDCIENLVVDGS